MNPRIVFKFKDCKLQFYEKRRLFCYFSVNPCIPASRWRRLLKPKTRKKKTLVRLSLASLSPHHYSQQQRSPFRLFIARQKLSNALKSLKSKKGLQESTNRESAIPTSYLQLALAHARNSRVKVIKIVSRDYQIFVYKFVKLRDCNPNLSLPPHTKFHNFPLLCHVLLHTC